MTIIKCTTEIYHVLYISRSSYKNKVFISCPMCVYKEPYRLFIFTDISKDYMTMYL